MSSEGFEDCAFQQHTLPREIDVAHVGLESLLAVLVFRKTRDWRTFVAVLIDPCGTTESGGEFTKERLVRV